MGRDDTSAASFLVCRDERRLCAFALADVAETMRPLPLQTLQGMPPFLLGVALIRGAMLPVVSLARLLGKADTDNDAPHLHANFHSDIHSHQRYVTLKLGSRQLAVAVQQVLGVRQLGSSTLADMPSLLREAGADVISAISTLDAELLLVLKGAHLIADDIWLALEKEAASA
ncbi:chemotaxis protein CheW [Undibacterium sp.]|uniref:chemotaxis protein CheW n=1 Tax=Undibacterium sp. TaxID=1914977 RepID=UPI00374DD5C3